MARQTQVLYGVGKAIIRDFTDPKKVVAMANLQDLSIESSSSQEDITGGNKLFPIASFKKDQGLKVSGTNADFDLAMLPYLEGTTPKVGVEKVTNFLEVAIPEDGIVALPENEVIVDGSIIVEGFEKATGEVTEAGKYSLAGNAVKFDTTDAGKVVLIVYEFNTSATAVTNSITSKSMAKPFTFDYIFDIYNDDSQVVSKGYIKVYKMQCTAGLKVDVKHQTAFAPKFEASAKDAKRADGRLWALVVDGVAID